MQISWALHQVWYGRKPDVNNMKIFGSIAYSHIPKELRGKLDPKTEKCILVGYAQNGYRLWDLRKERVIVSRDVIFDEKSIYQKTR